MGTQEREQVRQEVITELKAEQAEYMRKYRIAHPDYVKRMTDRQRAKRQALREQKIAAAIKGGDGD